MNLLFLAPNLDPEDVRDGITYNFIIKEMEALTRREHRVFFLTRDRLIGDRVGGVTCVSRVEVLEKGTLRRRFRHIMYALRHANMFGRFLLTNPKRVQNVVAVERAVKEILGRYSIDVVHCHFFYPGGECAILACGEADVPVVATLRGAELYNRPDIDYGSLRIPFFRRMLNLSLPRLAAVTAPNGALVADIVQKFNVPEGRVHHLPNGVEIAEVPDRSAPTGEELRLIAVGRLIPRKNHEIVIRALSRLQRADVSMRIVGRGPLRDKLSEMIQLKNIKGIELVEEMTKHDLYIEIQRSHCLVHPSILEGMPNVVLESLMLGRPCIVSDIEPHREIIEEGRTGYFFEPTDAGGLAKILGDLVAAPKRLAEMGSACRNRAREFSLMHKMDGYEAIYKRVTKE